MEKKEIDKLIETLGSTVLFGASETERRIAAQALLSIGDSSAVPALIKAIGNNSQFVKVGAITALGYIKDTSAVPALMVSLEDRDYLVRSAAATVLKDFKGPRTVPALIKALEGAHAQKKAAETLENIKDSRAEVISTPFGQFTSSHTKESRAVSTLKQALEEDEQVRGIAAITLGEIKDPSAVPALIRALEDNFAKGSVASALGMFKDPRAIPALLKALSDHDDNVRTSVASALGEINDMRALKALEYVMKNDSHIGARMAAFKASAKIRSSRGILEEEPTHKISAGGDILVDSAKFSATFSDSSTKISDVGVIKGNVGGKKEVPFSKCPYCGAELNLPKTPKFCPYCGDLLRE